MNQSKKDSANSNNSQQRNNAASVRNTNQSKGNNNYQKPRGKEGPQRPKNSKPIRRETSVSAAYSTGMHQTMPKITRTASTITIEHSELITNIVGVSGGAFTISSTIAINPGLATSFPWLSTQAIGWERYRFESLDFCYYTRTGSTTAGSFMMAPDYNASDSAPTSEQNASTYEDTVEDVPWKNSTCKLSTRSMHALGPTKFIRNGAVTGDIKTYDAGNIYLITVDGTNVNWGKVWASYKITLYTPQTPPGGLIAVANAFHAYGATPTTANLFANPGSTSGSNLAIVTVPSTGSIITFKLAGVYLVTYDTSTTSNTFSTAPAVSAGSNFLTTSSFFLNNGNGYNNFGNTAAYSCSQYAVNMAAGGTLTLYVQTIVAGVSWDLQVIAIPSIVT